MVTVCDNAKETCPLFPNAVQTLHIGFEDPSGKDVHAYSQTFDLLEQELSPVVEKALCD